MRTKVRTKIKNYAGRNYKKVRSPETQSNKSRSSQMSRIRSKNTKFEVRFISLLENILPGRFITHVTSIIGKPDIVFEEEKICIFLDSDFWHGWQYPRWKHLMKNDFWREKIEKNRLRDKNTTIKLRKDGWCVLRFWEHTLKTHPELAILKIQQTIKNCKNNNV
jgi:DNA mismatch endonuclease (patch repair protein)